MEVKENDFDVCRNKLKQMAENVVKMEDKFDYSMEGVWIDQLVTNYASIKGLKLIEMFEFIMNHQKEDYDSYGDIDTSITKLKVKGKLDSWKNWKDHDFITSGIFLQDNPTCATENKWVIIKIEKRHKPAEGLNDKFLNDFTEITYHVRTVRRSIVNADISKIVKYGDFRDENYVVTIVKDSFVNKNFHIKDDRGMMHYYKKMEHVMRNLSSAYFELTRDNK